MGPEINLFANHLAEQFGVVCKVCIEHSHDNRHKAIR